MINTTNLKFLVLVLFFALFSFLATVAIYLGLFKSVEVTKVELPAYHLVYKLHVGAYHKIGGTITEVEKWAKEKGITCDLTFGEYFSDPNEVSEDLLRSHGGCVVESLISDLPEGYSQKTLDPQEAIHAKFNGSPAIGPYKVYGKADEFAEKQKLKKTGVAMEFYKVKDRDMETTYYFPVEGKTE
jgi:effector-binding domain-containing protein